MCNEILLLSVLSICSLGVSQRCGQRAFWQGGGSPSLVLSLLKRVVLATPFGIEFPDVFIILLA